jgi:molecular chaperone GrpE
MENERDLPVAPEPGEAPDTVSAGSQGEASAAAPNAAAVEQSEAYQKVLAERKDLYDRLLRKQAELENFRKRTQREKEDLRQYAAEDLIRSLLPTLDGFERALQQRDEIVPAAFYQGLELIYRGFREVLGRAGLAPIDTAGQLFDPHLHQAVETVTAPDRREHEVVEELQRGYKLKHKLLRPAIVKVAVGGKPAQNPGDAQE